MFVLIPEQTGCLARNTNRSLEESPDDTLVCDNDITRRGNAKGDQHQSATKGQRSKSSGNESSQIKVRRRRSKEAADSSAETPRRADIYCTPTKKNLYGTQLNPSPNKPAVACGSQSPKMSPSKSSVLHKSKDNSISSGDVNEKPLMYSKENNANDIVNDSFKDTEKLEDKRKATSTTENATVDLDQHVDRHYVGNKGESSDCRSSKLDNKHKSDKTAQKASTTEIVQQYPSICTGSNENTGSVVDTIQSSLFSGIVPSGMYRIKMLDVIKQILILNSSLDV